MSRAHVIAAAEVEIDISVKQPDVILLHSVVAAPSAA